MGRRAMRASALRGGRAAEEARERREPIGVGDRIGLGLDIVWGQP